MRTHQSIPCTGAVTPRLGMHALLAALLLAGCSSDPATAPLDSEPDPVPDFSLRDVNTTSPRFDEMVSPRDYEGEVSVWYFGHAT